MSRVRGCSVRSEICSSERLWTTLNLHNYHSYCLVHSTYDRLGSGTFSPILSSYGLGSWSVPATSTWTGLCRCFVSTVMRPCVRHTCYAWLVAFWALHYSSFKISTCSLWVTGSTLRPSVWNCWKVLRYLTVFLSGLSRLRIPVALSGRNQIFKFAPTKSHPPSPWAWA